MPVTRDYPACIALYANPDGFVGAILLPSSLDGRRSRMDHRAAKLIEIRCRKDASILYRLKPLFYLIWALLALTRTGHLSSIIRESLLHLEAKAVLQGLIGHDFYLPNLSLIDSVPHTSRYRNAGKLEFKKYGKLTVLPVPGSSVLKFGPETYKSFIPGTGCMTKIEDVKTERDCGAMCPEGLIPDAVALLSHADTEIWVAIEFRVSHPKAIEDVRKYATVDFPVMEISITDDIANAGDTRKSLAERITGTGHATRFAGREWLYSPAAKKILRRSWHIETEPSDKPLRHKGTDLVRLETPLPAITVYAVKGAPTGEASWDNIDLTLREISEATVEKQEEALRKKRSLSSRCPSYKNSAPAGRQIKQTEDTGFETPTKPHGILGRLKGLFDKFWK